MFDRINVWNVQEEYGFTLSSLIVTSNLCLTNLCFNAKSKPYVTAAALSSRLQKKEAQTPPKQNKVAQTDFFQI